MFHSEREFVEPGCDKESSFSFTRLFWVRRLKVLNSNEIKIPLQGKAICKILQISTIMEFLFIMACLSSFPMTRVQHLDKWSWSDVKRDHYCNEPEYTLCKRHWVPKCPSFWCPENCNWFNNTSNEQGTMYKGIHGQKICLYLLIPTSFSEVSSPPPLHWQNPK